MTRRHKSNYYSSEGLRQLQAQINELWEHLEALRQAYVKSEDTADTNVSTVMDVVDRQDATPAAATFMDVAAHDPQPFKVVSTGRGWYQVVDIREGKAIHEGKLRRDAANEACEKAMQSAA